MRTYNVAIVGTGAVGQMILNILEEREFPVGGLKLLATKRSAGKTIYFRGEPYIIEETSPDSFEDVEIAMFAGGGASTQFARGAVEKGAIVIDNSSAFRLDPQVPLIVPEVNSHAIDEHHGIISNPNCSTTQMVMALKPLHDAAVIKRVVVSTYQAVSGAGKKAVDELSLQTRNILNENSFETEIFTHQIAFNLIPHIDVFLDNGYSKEEMKMVDETKKILGDDSMGITATAARVPVYTGHAESINIETEKSISAAEARAILSSAPGIKVVDNLEKNRYPMPIDCADSDFVYVGRIREDNSIEKGLNLWVVSDNLRKGAATNAVQIAELVISKNLI
ncbi:MAG: aspartate-semialdehyde dehydrogenase [Clostridia bacterium]|nr:aspartate-semialdehyde dehydrogenase [Clostridia bacterium]